MSAFICNADHIKHLAVFAASRDPDGWQEHRVDPSYIRHDNAPPNWSTQPQDARALAELYALILYSENIKSVSHRYGDTDIDALPGPNHKPARITITEGDMSTFGRLPPVHLIKMVNCLEYQSCEHDEWRASLAWELCRLIKDAAARELPAGRGNGTTRHTACRASRAMRDAELELARSEGESACDYFRRFHRWPANLSARAAAYIRAHYTELCATVGAP